MNRKVLFSVIICLLVTVLTACQCQHDWIEADCTTAKTCAQCKEVIGEPLGHSWSDATCEHPKTCSVCGRTEGNALSATGHQWVPASCTAAQYCQVCHTTAGDPLGHNWIGAVNRSGIEGRICTNCEEMEMMAYEWIPLTEFEKVRASNEEAHFQDIKVGDWDTRAGELPDSIRFCVSAKESYKKVHSVTYQLLGNFDHLSGLVSFMDKSDKYASATIKIYLDEQLEFESNPITYLSADQSFTLDARGVKTVRILCSTTEEDIAYCVLSASVY